MNVDWNSLFERVLQEEIFIPSLIALSVVSVVIVKAVAGMFTSVSRERTRREIAAYIAEGTMTPEQGERLLKASDERRGC